MKIGSARSYFHADCDMEKRNIRHVYTTMNKILGAEQREDVRLLDGAPHGSGLALCGALAQCLLPALRLQLGLGP